MKTADEVRTPRAQTDSGHPTHAAGGHGKWRFLRHYLEMVAAMFVGMVAWMRHRGHGWASTLEMAGAMFAPAVVLFPLLWLGVITGDSLVVLEHLAMFPFMYLVMRRRHAEYGGISHG
jgi:hypothetical protein